MAIKHYKAGKYKLIKKITTEDVGPFRETVTVDEETILYNVTSSQAKVLFELYDRLGFYEIEFIE